MNSLNVFLAPTGAADGVLSVLTDLSAAGLVDPFVWITNPSDSTPPQAMVQIVNGRAVDASIQQIFSSQRIDVTRVCVIVPLLNSDVPLTLPQERYMADLLAANAGTAKTVRVRCLLARPGIAAPATAQVAIDGWHNIMISPEDGRGPGLGHVQLPADPTPVGVGRHAAPVIAGLLGLWSNLEHHPLDDAPALPGPVIRLARSFYRKLETGDAEATLRQRLLAQDGTLPLPSDQRSPVAYVHDVGLATNGMANALWRKHAAVLKGSRESYDVQQIQKVGWLAALKMFCSFLWAAIKNAPGAWRDKMVDSVSTGLAKKLDKAVFGGEGSAYTVVVNGRTARGDRAGWAEIGEASGRLSGVLSPGDVGEHSAHTDLSAVWQDYSRAAMTLADAGARSTELPPVQVGANRGIVAKSVDVVPGPKQRFTSIPGNIAADLEVSSVDSTDLLGILNLRQKLSDLERTPEHGLQSRSTLTALDNWQRETSQSFGVAVGTRLADAFRSVYDEIVMLLNKLGNAQQPPSEPGRDTRLARWIQFTILFLLVVSGVVAYLAYGGYLMWWWSVLIAVVVALLGFALCLRAFMRSQRDLFQLINKRRAMLNEMEVDHKNLRAALRDLKRLSQGYGEFLSWSRALGAFIAAPLGPDTYRRRDTLRVSWGLPMSTAIGFAAPPESDVDTTVGYLRRDLFSLGWLSGSWEKLVIAAQPPLPGSREMTAEDSPLWTQAGRGSSSPLDQWSSALYSGEKTSTGADVLWERAIQTLMGPMSQLVDTLVSHVETPGGPTMPTDQFLAQIDRPAAPAGDFDRTMLTDSASIEGAGKVAEDVRTQTRHGIGVLCVSTQLSDGIPMDYLAGFAPVAAQQWNAPIPAGAYESGTGDGTDDVTRVDPFQAPGISGGSNF